MDPVFDDLLDLDNGTISGAIFTDEEIYQEELAQVFARSWLFLAHDTMIPKAGDFLQQYMGEDPVVVVRQKDGSIAAFLNQCTHRGMRICRADKGNAKAFMCSFHGWGYDLSGNLTHVPHEDVAYPVGTLDKSQWGARRVPRITNYKGFIFGTWDLEAPEFVDYLGEMAWYFDGYIDRYEGGMEAIAVHKWVIPANWKFNAEQPASDMYHAEVSHASAMQVMSRNVQQKMGDNEFNREGLYEVSPGQQFTSPLGHGSGWFDRRIGSLSLNPEIADWENSRRDETLERLGERRALSVRGHGNIFPNFMFLMNNTFRVTHPRGPGEMEIWAWTSVPKAAPDEVKEQYRINVLRTFSPGGMFEQDDAENWLEIQRILRGHVARKGRLNYRMQLGATARDVDDLPGLTTPHCYSDAGARGLYRHWARLLSGMTWAEIMRLADEAEGLDHEPTAADALGQLHAAREESRG